MGWTEIVVALIGVLAGGGLTAAATLGPARGKAKLDLIRDLNSELADKSRKIRELQGEVLHLISKCHEFEMHLLSTRCDKQSCGFRDPPLPWMSQAPASLDTDGDGIPDRDPEPGNARTPSRDMIINRQIATTR